MRRDDDLAGAIDFLEISTQDLTSAGQRPIGPPARVIIVCVGELGSPESRLIQIVEFLGASAQIVRLAEQDTVLPALLDFATASERCVIISADALHILQRISGDLLAGNVWSCLGSAVLVYGLDATHSGSGLLRELTAGALLEVERLGPQTDQVDVARDLVCRQLAGLSFRTESIESRATFVVGEAHAECVSLISVSGRPSLVRLCRERCEVMLFADAEFADLDSTVSRESVPLHFFLGLAPVMIFLRSVLRRRVWHVDSPRACFIIDDPLLKNRYGFLNYRKLLDVMVRERFSTSIAFIPWNHERSRRRVADLLGSHPYAFSLCVHGCDHTRGEFGTSDPESLRRQSRLAIERMQSHRRRTGLGFDDVMVFPQGIFSMASMAALKSCGYLAAVNSTPWPVDAEPPLTIRDLLQGALTRFANFPLFSRRYPRQLPDLAFDLFLGKPLLLVEHHDFFRDGYDAITNTIADLRRLEPRLEWTNLATICSRACWKRVAEDGEICVRFFTDRFELRNDATEPRWFVATRQRSQGLHTRMTINGELVDVLEHGGYLQVRVRLDAGESVEIRLTSEVIGDLAEDRRPSLLYRSHVFLRRHLSEWRDDYFARMSTVFRGMENGR